MAKNENTNKLDTKKSHKIKNWDFKTVLALILLVLFLKTAEYLYFSSAVGKNTLNDIQTYLTNHFKETGFILKYAFVKGNVYTSQDEVLLTSGIKQGSLIYDININEIREKLEKLPWIKEVIVYKILPDTIKIDIVEHNPIGIWQEKGEKPKPITDEGILLTDMAILDNSMMNLPIVTGKNGYKELPKILKVLATYLDLADKVKALVFVGERRWNLIFDDSKNSITVYLPDTNVEQAWKKLKKYEENHKIFKRKLTLIDLRLQDKLIVRLEVSDKKVKNSNKLKNKKNKILKVKEQEA